MTDSYSASISKALQRIFHQKYPASIHGDVSEILHAKNQEIDLFFFQELPEITNRETSNFTSQQHRRLHHHLTTFFLQYGCGSRDCPHASESRSNPESPWPPAGSLHLVSLTGTTKKSVTNAYFLFPGIRKHLFRNLKTYTGHLLVSHHYKNGYPVDPPKNESEDLACISVFQGIAREIINAISDIEEKLSAWYEMPRKPVQKHICTSLHGVPEVLWPQILSNPKQRADWRDLALRLGAAGKKMLKTESPDIEFLRTHRNLCIDTRHFPNDFKTRLLELSPELDENPDGFLVAGNNFHGLRHIRDLFEGKIQCIYIDPPFNTGNRTFNYPDEFTPAAWLTMMENRLIPACNLLTDNGTFFVHIDNNQKASLKLLMDQYLHFITEIIWRIGWVSGFKSRAAKFIRNHDTIYHYGKSEKPLFIKQVIPYPEGYVRRDGKKPTGPGYPLEDTWNCSAMDALNSVQILSFSKEKIGSAGATQKNENLLERIIASATHPEDRVLDYFAGSGTTCAAAHKMGRKWIGMDRKACVDTILAPRMKTVLSGDPFGISSGWKWQGGGTFHVIDLDECLTKT